MKKVFLFGIMVVVLLLSATKSQAFMNWKNDPYGNITSTNTVKTPWKFDNKVTSFTAISATTYYGMVASMIGAGSLGANVIVSSMSATLMNTFALRNSTGTYHDSFRSTFLTNTYVVNMMDQWISPKNTIFLTSGTLTYCSNGTAAHGNENYDIKCNSGGPTGIYYTIFNSTTPMQITNGGRSVSWGPANYIQTSYPSEVCFKWECTKATSTITGGNPIMIRQDYKYRKNW